MLASTPRVATTPKYIAGPVPRQRSTLATTTGLSRYFATSYPAQKQLTLLQDKHHGFGFARSNPRPPKPRSKGVTEIRGPYYTVCAFGNSEKPERA
jgi:hypothetical protein